MARYTLGDALPLAGASASLLTAAVQHTYPTTLTELARTAGISKFASSRAAQPLLQAGLLRTDHRGYTFNDQHPLAAVVKQLAWRFSGVRRQPADSSPYRAPLEMRTEEFHYQSLVPPSLQIGAPRSPDLQVATGPDLVSARDTCNQVVQLSPALGEFWGEGQEAYSLWSNERVRDLIHGTLHLGGALRAAHDTLAPACDHDAQGEANPFEVRVNAYAWLRATFLVSAEVRDVLSLIGLLDRAVWLGDRVNDLQAEAVRGLNHINYAGRSSTSVGHHLTDALEAEKQADELFDDRSHGVWHHFGGTPQPHDVGGPGDQFVAVRLRGVARELSALVTTMAKAHCVQEWISANPSEVQALPLVCEIPERALRGRRDWPAPAPRSAP